MLQSAAFNLTANDLPHLHQFHPVVLCFTVITHGLPGFRFQFDPCWFEVPRPSIPDIQVLSSCDNASQIRKLPLMPEHIDVLTIKPRLNNITDARGFANHPKSQTSWQMERRANIGVTPDQSSTVVIVAFPSYSGSTSRRDSTNFINAKIVRLTPPATTPNSGGSSSITTGILCRSVTLVGFEVQRCVSSRGAIVLRGS